MNGNNFPQGVKIFKINRYISRERETRNGEMLEVVLTCLRIIQ